LADTTTTRYAFVKPEVGASADTWGSKWNTNNDDYDALLGAITTTGSANAYVLTTGLSLAAYVAGQSFDIKTNFGNTGAATIAVDGLAAKDLRKNGTTALASGDLASGRIYRISYDGTVFQVLGDVTAGLYQPPDATLTALAALSYTSGTLYLTMTAADTFALANDATLVKTTGTQTVGGAKTFTSEFTVSSTFPLRRIIDTDAAADNGRFREYSDAGVLYYDICNDAESVATVWLQLTRSGSSVTSVDIKNGSLLSQSTAVLVAGKQAIPIPASAMVSNTTNGPSIGVTETATNKVMLRTLDFDTTTQEGAQFLIPMPKGWNEGTVTFQPVWTASAGSAADTVVWELRAVALSDDDAADTAFGTGQTSSDALIATGDIHIGPESSAITIAGTPAENDLVVFQIRRNVASDNLPNDAKLIAIRLFITTNAKNDA